MDVFLDPKLTENYSSNTQKARVLTEGWASVNLYCPVCGHARLNKFANNQKVADFFCSKCEEQYELKSKDGRIGKKVPDGAYDSFVQRISERSNPDFFFMSYGKQDMKVHELWFVPKFFFVPEIAEKRKPLGENARRHGWVGCNILFDQIPIQGRIPIIRDSRIIDKDIVEAQVGKAFGMKVDNLDSRGWLFDVLQCVNGIVNAEFTLQEMYRYESLLEIRHPGNNNIRPKIRQQLQVLRDKEIIEFLGNGRYRKCDE